jgi:hypothetical protein
MMADARSGLRNILEVAILAVVGIMIIVVPVAMNPNVHMYDAEFLPIVRTAVEGMRFAISLPLLVLLGSAAGALSRLPSWGIGIASISLLPAWSTIDLVAGGDHNLLPIEWVFYGIYSLPVILGAAGLRSIRSFFTRRSQASDGRRDA